MLDFLKNDGIINLVHDFGELCNGSTTDSDSVCWGSNPYSAAKKTDHDFMVCFSLYLYGCKERTN